jgi:hypothetical protein
MNAHDLTEHAEARDLCLCLFRCTGRIALAPPAIGSLFVLTHSEFPGFLSFRGRIVVETANATFTIICGFLRGQLVPILAAHARAHSFGANLKNRISEISFWRTPVLPALLTESY